jgi:hypothetical protein
MFSNKIKGYIYEFYYDWIGYVANDDININNNGNKDKTSIIEFARNEFNF